MVMPVMSGRELVEHAARGFPDLRIVVMSGHTEDPTLRQGQRSHDWFGGISLSASEEIQPPPRSSLRRATEQD